MHFLRAHSDQSSRGRRVRVVAMHVLSPSHMVVNFLLDLSCPVVAANNIRANNVDNTVSTFDAVITRSDINKIITPI